MFITENQSIAESILFLLSARESLCYMVEGSSVDHKDTLKNFLMNEASDYEIMHMLIHEEMPNEKYNFSDEVRLFSDLKEQVLINFSTIGKYLGEDAVTFINKVDTVYPDFSSAAPILEFQLDTKDHVLNELFDKEGTGIQKAIDFFKGIGSKHTIDADATGKKVDAIKKSISSYLGAAGRKAVATGKGEVAVLKLTNKGVDPAVARKMVASQKGLLSKIGVDNYVKGAAGQVKRAAALAKDKAAAATDAAQSKAIGGAAKAGEKMGLRGGPTPQAPGMAAKAAKMLATIKLKAQAAGPALSQAVTSPAGMAVGGAALAALALYASVKVYKRFMSKAAKSCAGQSGSAKTMCMKKYQHSAIGAQVKDLTSAMSACAKSKSPEKCKVPIQKKISKLQVKMQKMKAQMAA